MSGERKPETHQKQIYSVVIGIIVGSICFVIVVSLLVRFTYKRFMSSKEFYSLANPGQNSDPIISVKRDETINMTEAVTQDGRPSADTIYCEIDDDIYDTINDSDIISSYSSIDSYFDGTPTNQDSRLPQMQHLPPGNSTVHLESPTQDDNIVYVEDPSCADIIYVVDPSCVDAAAADTNISSEVPSKAVHTNPASLD